jgi:Retrotransposon gag protein
MDFVTAFDANFSNIAQKQQAMSALYHLHMQKDRFNDYVAAFKHFAKQAEFDLTHPATIQLFVMGIENNLQNAILYRD